MKDDLTRLRTLLGEAWDLEMIRSLMQWDQATYMPDGGASARGRQLALIGRLTHEHSTDPEIGRLLDRLEREVAKLPHDSDEASLVRVTRRAYDRATRVPPAFVSEMLEHFSTLYQAWVTARPANDFATLRPMLERTVDLSRRYSGFFPGAANVADPLIDQSDENMTVAKIRPLFGALRASLVPLAAAITSRPVPDDAVLRHAAPPEDQLAFGLEVIRRFGYDFDRGRQDLTHHPFMTKFSLGDVRITTRTREEDLVDALFSTMHEAGHAMYEQGIRREYEGTPLANGASSGVHESQSRTWENLVGRSRGFWEHFYPRFQKAFPVMSSVPLDAFYRAINRVERSLIRIESDEVTYNLHVMIRFDLEVDLLEGKLAVKDLPEAWHARYQADLGMRAPDDRNGVLQDVHWYSGPVGGAFQGYTLGNILGAQFFGAAVRARPGIPAEIAAGKFDGLHGWLREQVYQHGAKFTADELIQRVTGGPMSIEPYLDYLWEKYAPLYGLRQDERAPAGVA